MKSCASQQQAQQNAMLDSESEAEAEIDDGESPTPTEPEHLMCSLSYMMLREPMFVPESGRTYERSFLEAFWKTCGETKDPVINVVINQSKTYPNWDVRRQVHQFLDEFPLYTPEGWPDRTVPPPPDTSFESRLTMRERIHAACVFAATNWFPILLTTELLLVDVLALLMMGIGDRIENRMNANLTSWCAPQDYSIANLFIQNLRSIEGNCLGSDVMDIVGIALLVFVILWSLIDIRERTRTLPALTDFYMAVLIALANSMSEIANMTFVYNPTSLVRALRQVLLATSANSNQASSTAGLFPMYFVFVMVVLQLHRCTRTRLQEGMPSFKFALVGALMAGSIASFALYTGYLYDLRSAYPDSVLNREPFGSPYSACQIGFHREHLTCDQLSRMNAFAAASTCYATTVLEREVAELFGREASPISPQANRFMRDEVHGKFDRESQPWRNYPPTISTQATGVMCVSDALGMSRAALEGAKRELERERLNSRSMSEVCFSLAARDRLGPSISYVYAALGPIDPSQSPGYPFYPVFPISYPRSSDYGATAFASDVDHHLASIRVLSVSPISYPSADYGLPPDCLPARDVDILCERIQAWIRTAYPEAENLNYDLGMPHLDATALFYNSVVRLMAVLLVVLKITPRIAYIVYVGLYVQPDVQIPDVLGLYCTIEVFLLDPLGIVERSALVIIATMEIPVPMYMHHTLILVTLASLWLGWCVWVGVCWWWVGVRVCGGVCVGVLVLEGTKAAIGLLSTAWAEPLGGALSGFR
jgi:hypothetical protein